MLLTIPVDAAVWLSEIPSKCLFMLLKYKDSKCYDMEVSTYIGGSMSIIRMLYQIFMNVNLFFLIKITYTILRFYYHDDDEV